MDNLENFMQIVPKEKLKMKEPMKKHTSFKIGGDADYFIKVDSVSLLKDIVKEAKEIPIFVMGNGSNLLVRDKGIRGIVLQIDLKEIEIEKKEDVFQVRVGAGVPLSGLAYQLWDKGISGLEFASGIPGTIGGAIRMNAGAYGTEMKDIVVNTTYMDRKGNIKTLENREQEFEYRHSIFCKKNWIILGCTLQLKKGNKEEIKAKMDDYKNLRKEKQPTEPSAGSTFKRGKNFITAALIDECSLKGMRIGDAEVSTKHAGFIINKGNASAEDVLTLVKQIKEQVKKQKGKEIELEIEVIGEE